jgi:rhamnose utilization protein RhaD (predicted bifunctional aldolase and dehydrogenase)
MNAGCFVPLDLAEVITSIRRKSEISVRSVLLGNATPSIETAMHAIIRHRVVIHVHSINAIAWAIRLDAPELLEERLTGLHWRWVPYAPSGLPLAQAVEAAISDAPETDVLVLGNHGLVVCGQDCHSAEQLLRKVEQRLLIVPRSVPAPDMDVLGMIVRFTDWRFPESELLHAFGTDPLTLQIVKSGVLYPCQAIFLGAAFPLLPPTVSVASFSEESREEDLSSAFVTIEKCGTMLSEKINFAECATLLGLAQVALRIGESTPLRYLNRTEINHVLSDTLHSYKTGIAAEKQTDPSAAISIPAQ